MTCIVAITDGKRTVMGADSAAGSTDNPEIYDFATSKLFQKGEYLVGVCGSYRSGQLARYEMEWPDPPEDPAELEGFLVREVVKKLRELYKEAGHVPPPTAAAMVAIRGRIFVIGNDNSVGSLANPWCAIGSGRHTAYGALHVLASLDLGLEEKVSRALAAAQAHTSNVREPLHLQIG